LILPQIDQGPVFDKFAPTLLASGYVTSYPGPNGPIGNEPTLRSARHTPIMTFYCPSDIGVPLANELNTGSYGFYRASYRGCVGSGDMYGNAVDASDGPWGLGVFSVRPGQSFDTSPKGLGIVAGKIRDGASQTLLFSEGLAGRSTSGWGGVIGEILYGNMGGSLFSASLTPNSAAPDRPIGPCPQNVGDREYPAPCVALGSNAWWTPSAKGAYATARSRHPGGVVISMADSAVRFVNDGIDLAAWRGMATRDGGEPPYTP
jgi:hypothetical protein